MAIYIYYTTFEEKLPDTRFNALLQEMPVSISSKILRYTRWQDAHASLLGKHLLTKALSHFNIAASLHDLQYTATGRPYLQQPVDFNITHAGNMVVCAASTGIKLGIDLEEVKPLDFSDFHGQFTAHEWENIHTDANPLQRFYYYWTIKEAVVKADGIGISELHTLSILNKEAVALNKTTWYITAIPLLENYICHLATAIQQPDIIVERISW